MSIEADYAFVSPGWPRDRSGEKYCPKCQAWKEKKLFSFDVTRSSGIGCWCAACTAIHRAQPEIKKRNSDVARIWRGRNPIHCRLGAALNNARKRNPCVTITLDQLKELLNRQSGKCALSGITMTFGNDGKQGAKPTSCSVDRIDIRFGYTPENVRLICWAINAFRGQMNDADTLAMAREIVRHMDGNR